MSILLYHGSSTGVIHTLQPFTADHGKPYVYFSTNAVSAVFHAARAIERPYYWVPYGYDAQGKIVYTEVWKNAFSDVFSGKTGYLYCCEADDKTLLRFPTHRSLRVSTQAVAVSKCERIEDLCVWLLQREQEGWLSIQRYETLTPAQLSLWHGMVLEELITRFSGAAPDNPYIRFVQERMPAVWERFLHESQ
ncbi:MAG: hypothetical protein Q8S22_09865 [Eubacteriales bacterium]|jgi:hypothetical protein|nr:hypothetical protein [Eubacteriales bacterium]